MSYQVLARRLRPKDFDGLVGQDHVVRALRNGLDSGRVHHAYLFTGTRGVGKTTIARILAKSLNCEAGVSSKPCGACSICREIGENRFIDLIEVDAASRTRVDDTRELLDNAQYLPARGRYKVYLIDEVHMLSASSFNAFLKTLEEPPEHVKFLLATTDPRKVPVTVLSRCLQFQLKNIGREEIACYIGDVLTGEGVEYEAEAVRIIAKSAQGSMRDALSITDQAIAYSQGPLAATDVAAMVGAAGRNETRAVVEALAGGDPRRVLELSAALAEKSVDFGSVLAELLEALHDMAVDHALGENPDAPLSPEAVQLYYQIALVGYRDLFIGPDPKTGFEMTLLRMLAFAPDAASAARVPAAGGEPRKSTEAGPPAGGEPRKPVEAGPPAGGEPRKSTEAGPPVGGEPRKSVEAGPPAGGEPRKSVAAGPPAGGEPRKSVEAGPPVGGEPRKSTEAGPPAGGEPRKSMASEPPAGGESRKSMEAGSHAGEQAGIAMPGGRGGERPAPASIEPPETAPAPDLNQTASAHPDVGQADASGRGQGRKWHQLVEQLSLTGIGRMIAENSLLVGRDSGSCRLVLDRRHESLLNGGAASVLEQALAELFGEPIRLSIEVGEPARETPAQRNGRLARERRAAARRELEENATVQSLISTLDGRLEEVRPVDAGDAGDAGDAAERGVDG